MTFSDLVMLKHGMADALHLDMNNLVDSIVYNYTCTFTHQCTGAPCTLLFSHSLTHTPHKYRSEINGKD